MRVRVPFQPCWERAGAHGVWLSHSSTRAASSHDETDLGDGEEDEGEEGDTLGQMKAFSGRGNRWHVREEEVERDLGMVEGW